MKFQVQGLTHILMVAVLALAGSISLLPASVAVAASKAPSNVQELQIRLGSGRVVFLEYIKASQEGAPTFLLLPGVNRSLLAKEEGPQAIVKNGYGMATMNFSVQPFSVNVLAKNEVPFFMDKGPSLQDLADEVEQTAKYLRTQVQVGTVIPVSLSYSGAVSPFLKGFPLIVDTVPLTSSAAQNPQLESYRNSLKMGEIWNPIFGPGITRSLLDQAYRSQWSEQVDSLSKQFDLSTDRREQMIEGYMTLSRATEGFEWDLKQLTSARRVFLFAEHESKSLLEHQVATFEALYEKDAKTLVFVVKDSGHLIPGDQPAAYANIMTLVAQGKVSQLSGVVEVDSAARKTRTFQGAQAKAYLSDLISKAE